MLHKHTGIMMGSATNTTAPFRTAKDDATMKEWTKEDLNRHLLELLRRQRNRDAFPPSPPRSSVSAMEERTARPAMMLRSTTDAATSSSGEATINSDQDEKDIADDDTVDSPHNDDSPRVSSPSSSSWLIKTLLLSSSNFSSKTTRQQLDADTDEKEATHFLFEDIVTTATSIVESDGPRKTGHRHAWHCHVHLFRTAGLCFILLFLLAYVQIIPLVLLFKTSSSTSLSTTTRPNRLELKFQGPSRRKAVTVATTTPRSSHDHYDCTRSNRADNDPQVTLDGLWRGGSSVREDHAVGAAQDLFHQQGVAAGQIFCEQLLPDLSPATVAWCAMHLLL
jgi:hypothetical protein